MTLEMLDRWLCRTSGLEGVFERTVVLTEDFMDLAARWARQTGTVALMSGGELDCARFHLLGILPWLTLCAKGRSVALTIDGRTVSIEADPFDVLRVILKWFDSLSPSLPDMPMTAGLMGYLAYDLKDHLETLPRTSVDELNLPSMLLYAPSLLVLHDRRGNTTRLAVPVRAGGRSAAEALFEKFVEEMAAPVPPAAPFRTDPEGFRSNFSRTEYQATVRRIIDYISAGDVYQVNLSQRFRMPFAGDAFALFRQLFARNPAPFFAFIQGGDHQIVSTSPERFLRRSGDQVETRPIKGTRPRGRTPSEDLDLRQELAESGKDDAELSMIVDLLRNDFGKVCRADSIHVTDHKRIEAYANVYHLVSVVEGLLEPDKDSVDLIAAAFPGGSITGCPKVRAMEIIDELESCRRHVYCGSIGYIGFDRTLDLSIAIRTATVVNGILQFSVGGGIVYESSPLQEYRETLDKGRTLMTVCRRGSLRSQSARVWQNGRLQPARLAAVPITDEGLLYGYGFFETIRVDRMIAPFLEKHLERFDRTWKDLMPGAPPDLSWKHIVAQVVCANGLQHRCAAVKILASHGGRMQPPWDHTLLVTARPYTHRMKAIASDGLHLGTYPYPYQSPLAVYKTSSRLFHQRAGAWAHERGFHEALVLSPDGTVSETHTANLLLIDGRQAVRPASASALPGVMSAAVCGLLASWRYAIVERPVRPAELLTAHQVLATNSLMGAVPVAGLDGQGREAGDDLWMRINDALIPGWAVSFGNPLISTFPKGGLPYKTAGKTDFLF